LANGITTIDIRGATRGCAIAVAAGTADVAGSEISVTSPTNAVAVLHQEGQQVEDLGFQVDKLGAAAQFAALDVEPVVAKR
jgi:hypothetical protein